MMASRLPCVVLVFLLFASPLLAIPVSLMMPLNMVNSSNQLAYPEELYQNLQTVASGGIDGIMTDVWWGLVEQAGPQQYNWTPYLQLAQMVQQLGIKMQVVMSFHQCGTNVGDECYITLPSWVLDVGNSNPDIFYRDQQGGTDQEYLSLGVDDQAVFQGRTAIQIYTDYMQSFHDNFQNYLGSVIDEVQVGLGPAGEMRYPSYQLQDNKWTYCGIGEFQCYDSYMLASLKSAANGVGQPDWGNGGPDNAGTYDSTPSQTQFFSSGGYNNYQSNYGEFFLGWYSQTLLAHGENILGQAASIFASSGITVAAKVSGIHWWYGDPSHAAELTAGYFNTDTNNAYLQIAQMFAKNNIRFDFTALEMVDSDPSCDSEPQQLVQQTILAAQQAGITYSGENALDLCVSACQESGFDEIYTESTQYGAIARFTYLRMTPSLLSNPNWQTFVSFVQRMHSA